MGFLELISISVGLSMDAVAVSMTNGMSIKNAKIKHAGVIAAAFGIFQGVMPLIGYFAGSVFAERIKAIDHWIAVALLGFIGGKMIYEAVCQTDEACTVRPFSFKLILAQAVATSIDALAIGVSFAALNINIVFVVAPIALITFILCFPAVFIGKKFGTVLNSKAEIFGGIILIVTGLKIFLEHIFLHT